MRRLLIRVVLFTCCLHIIGLDSTVAQDDSQLVWYHAFFPPVTITEGPDQGKGFYDKITQHLIRELPQYDHTLQVANYQRMLQEIKDGSRVCCASLYKTAEREKFTAFSVPVVVVLPNGVTIRKDQQDLFKPYITEAGEIELDRVLQDEKLLLGVAKGRKYSGGIDEILAEYANDNNMIKRSGKDVFKGLLGMLAAGRVNYLLGYPVEAQYLAEKAGYRDQILFHPVAGTNQSYTLGYVGCPDTPWGRGVIDNINKVLLENRDTETFYGYYESWLDEKTARNYRKIASDIFQADPR